MTLASPLGMIMVSLAVRESSPRWLNKSYARDKFDLEVARHNAELVDLDSLFDGLTQRRTTILSFWSRCYDGQTSTCDLYFDHRGWWMVWAKVPFSHQWPLYEALRTTAAIIFAVIGAWMAIIYPERLRLSYKSPDEKPEDKADAAGELLRHSCRELHMCSCGCFAHRRNCPCVESVWAPRPHNPLWRGVSYALLVALTLWQAGDSVINIESRRSHEIIYA